MHPRRLLEVVRWLTIAAILLAPARPWAADAVERLVETLETSRSFKVRMQAAVLLARLQDPRVAQALGRAVLDDAHPIVRGTVVRLLARTATDSTARVRHARAVATRALRDRDPSVRRQAAAALEELERTLVSLEGGGAADGTAPRSGNLVVALGQMGDRTGRANAALRERLRDELRALLGRQGAVALLEAGTTGANFIVDGSISRLELVLNAQEVEAVCAVELLVSRPPRGILMVTSGEAIVQKPRAQYRPQLRVSMEEDALTHAVKSAYENLARFLAGQ